MSREHYKVSTSVVEGRQLQSSVSLGNYERFCTRTRIVGSHVAELVRLRVSIWLQLFAETMSFGLRLRERAIDAIKSKNSEIQCWLEARLKDFTVLVRRRQRTCHKTGPSTACVASTKSIWQELREIWPNNVQHPGRSQQCSRCQFDLREYVLDTEPSPAQLSTMVFYS